MKKELRNRTMELIVASFATKNPKTGKESMHSRESINIFYLHPNELLLYNTFLLLSGRTIMIFSHSSGLFWSVGALIAILETRSLNAVKALVPWRSLGCGGYLCGAFLPLRVPIMAKTIVKITVVAPFAAKNTQSRIFASFWPTCVAIIDAMTFSTMLSMMHR
jgi:hypothetical protein